MKKDRKIKYFGLRTTNKGAEDISKLARYLKVKNSEAVRRAVAYLLESIEAKPSPARESPHA